MRYEGKRARWSVERHKRKKHGAAIARRVTVLPDHPRSEKTMDSASELGWYSTSMTSIDVTPSASGTVLASMVEEGTDLGIPDILEEAVNRFDRNAPICSTYLSEDDGMTELDFDLVEYLETITGMSPSSVSVSTGIPERRENAGVDSTGYLNIPSSELLELSPISDDEEPNLVQDRVELQGMPSGISIENSPSLKALRGRELKQGQGFDHVSYSNDDEEPGTVRPSLGPLAVMDALPVGPAAYPWGHTADPHATLLAAVMTRARGLSWDATWEEHSALLGREFPTCEEWVVQAAYMTFHRIKAPVI